ncbi:RNA polymerase sigma factor [Silvibacterium acidisoli]|uniref:RNA polymerase sigma factor n=1 Tax=Acidobacteriaceae bacterium ZG23-2 TaxID=2883246 RepID=UPI00406CF68E
MGGDMPLRLDIRAEQKSEPEAVTPAGPDDAVLDFVSWKRVFRHAYSLVGNTADAEDLAQEAFTELFRAKAAGEPVRWIGAWMRTITQRLAYRSFNKQRPDLHVSLEALTQDGENISWEPQDTQPSREKQVIDQRMLLLGTKVLSELSDRERECVLMYFRGYDFPKIASALGISRWTARRLTLDVIKKVRAKL